MATVVLLVLMLYKIKILLQVKFLTPNLKPPWAVSYSTKNFGGTYYKIYACFEQKSGFCNAKFSEFGG